MYCKRCGRRLPDTGICSVCGLEYNTIEAGFFVTEAADTQSYCPFCGRTLFPGEVCSCGMKEQKSRKIYGRTIRKVVFAGVLFVILLLGMFLAFYLLIEQETDKNTGNLFLGNDVNAENTEWITKPQKPVEEEEHPGDSDQKQDPDPIEPEEEQEQQPILERIEIVKYPDKMEYQVGETLNLQGLELVAYYDDETKLLKDGFTGEVDTSSAGTKIVTVFYQGKTTSFSICVLEPMCYELQVISSNNAYGSVSGSGTYEQGETVVLEAIPKQGCVFEQWSDGNTSQSRTITVLKNDTLTAYFYGPISENWIPDDGLPENAWIEEEKMQYRYRTLQTTVSEESDMAGWDCVGSTDTWGAWGEEQATVDKPTESEYLRITDQYIRLYAYYHYCNRYASGKTGVDSCDVDGSGRRHTLYVDTELPAMYINADHGGRAAEARGGVGVADGCSWNYYAWWRDPENDEYIYYYQTRELITTYTFERYGNWSEWNWEYPQAESADIQVRTVYRYRPV